METKHPLAPLAADIIASYVEHNAVPQTELPELIGRVYEALARVAREGQEPAADQPPPKPAVTVRRSVTDDHIICLEDGLQFKSIKRHLATSHDMTPEQYRQRWNLPRDYPMTAAGYAKARSQLAKAAGLGRKPGTRRKRKTRG